MEVTDNTTLSRARVAKFGYLAFFMCVGALAVWQKRRFKTHLEKGAIQSVSLQQEVYGGKLFGQVFLNHGVKFVPQNVIIRVLFNIFQICVHFDWRPYCANTRRLQSSGN